MSGVHWQLGLPGRAFGRGAPGGARCALAVAAAPLGPSGSGAGQTRPRGECLGLLGRAAWSSRQGRLAVFKLAWQYLGLIGSILPRLSGLPGGLPEPAALWRPRPWESAWQGFRPRLRAGGASAPCPWEPSDGRTLSGGFAGLSGGESVFDDGAGDDDDVDGPQRAR